MVEIKLFIISIRRFFWIRHALYFMVFKLNINLFSQNIVFGNNGTPFSQKRHVFHNPDIIILSKLSKCVMWWIEFHLQYCVHRIALPGPKPE